MNKRAKLLQKIERDKRWAREWLESDLTIEEFLTIKNGRPPQGENEQRIFAQNCSFFMVIAEGEL